MKQLAAQHQKTPSQVLLRWMYEMGRGLITTTSKPAERLQEPQWSSSILVGMDEEIIRLVSG